MRHLPALFCALMLAACQNSPPDLREWTPADHHNTSNAKQKGQVTADAKSRVEGLDEVTLTTWTNKCTVCHGRVGAADGPQAPMYQPQDLTDPQWQDSVSDERLLASIQQGRNKMPAFNLPDTTAQHLVKLVRMLRRRTRERAAPEPTATATSAAARPTPPASAKVKTRAVSASKIPAAKAAAKTPTPKTPPESTRQP